MRSGAFSGRANSQAMEVAVRGHWVRIPNCTFPANQPWSSRPSDRRGNPMDDLVLRIPWDGARAPEREPLLTREWLVTNALGGYATGTVGGVSTRRYHGMLIA